MTLATQYETTRLLILANTYPVPSSKYIETNCVAAVTQQGELRRLFPIPYRLLEGSQKFKKWEWIEGRIAKATGDNRPESYRLDVDSIQRIGQISTKSNWSERLPFIMPHIVPGPDFLEARRVEQGNTLGIVMPSKLLGLQLERVNQPDWSPAELEKLRSYGLFDSPDVRQRIPLRKLPFRFYYHYEFETSDGPKTYKHMLTDWEAGALFWRCQRDYGDKWEDCLRTKLEVEMAQKDLLFMMGTMHRFPDTWLIVSMIYPPSGATGAAQQPSFLL